MYLYNHLFRKNLNAVTYLCFLDKLIFEKDFRSKYAIKTRIFYDMYESRKSKHLHSKHGKLVPSLGFYIRNCYPRQTRIICFLLSFDWPRKIQIIANLTDNIYISTVVFVFKK